MQQAMICQKDFFTLQYLVESLFKQTTSIILEENQLLIYLDDHAHFQRSLTKLLRFEEQKPKSRESLCCCSDSFGEKFDEDEFFFLVDIFASNEDIPKDIFMDIKNPMSAD